MSVLHDISAHTLRAARPPARGLLKPGVPQNVPGVPERSWRHKLRQGLEETMADLHGRNVLGRINERRMADGNEK